LATIAGYLWSKHSREGETAILGVHQHRKLAPHFSHRISLIATDSRNASATPPALIGIPVQGSLYGGQEMNELILQKIASK